jgi:hypothetical protein
MQGVEEMTEVLSTDLKYMAIAESQKDYSAEDEVQLKRFYASKPDTEAKVELFETYLVPGKWKQSDFAASSACILDSKNTEQSKLLGDLWTRNLIKVANNFDRDYFTVYFNNLKTTFLASESQLMELKTMRGMLSAQATKYVTQIKLLSEEIDLLELVI